MEEKILIFANACSRRAMFSNMKIKAMYTIRQEILQWSCPGGALEGMAKYRLNRKIWPVCYWPLQSVYKHAVILIAIIISAMKMKLWQE